MEEQKFNLTQTGQQVQSILNSAKNTDQVLTEIQEAMADLPDGQAVSAQVALNTAAIEELDEKVGHSDGTYDISEANAVGGVLSTYADLTAALGENGTNIPADLRKGGMSVKFVQSSDNKYVQYRLISDIFSITESDWQGVDDKPTVGSDNLIKSGGVKDAIDEVADKVFGISFDLNGYLDNYGEYVDIGTSYATTKFVKVNEGEKWYYTGQFSNSAFLGAVYGYADKSTVQSAVLVTINSSARKDYEFTIPSGVNYIRACSLNSVDMALYNKNIIDYRLTNLEKEVEDKADKDEFYIEKSAFKLIADSGSTVSNTIYLANKVSVPCDGFILKIKCTVNALKAFHIVIAAQKSSTSFTAKSKTTIIPTKIGVCEFSVNINVSKGDYVFFGQDNVANDSFPGYSNVSSVVADNGGGWYRCDGVPSIGEDFNTTPANGGVVNATYKIFIEKYKENNINILEVGIGKQYTKVYDAFVAAAALNQDVLINIYQGDYDYYTEFGGENFISSVESSATWNQILPTFTNKVTIKGIGDVNISMIIPDNIYETYTSVCNKLAIINNQGDIYIKDISLTVKNCRYAIHDESNGSDNFIDTIHKFENIRVNTQNCLASCGIGLSTAEYEFYKCIFKGGALYMHSWPVNKGAKIKICDTVLVNSLKLNNYGAYRHDVFIGNCYVSSANIGTEDSTNYTTNYFDILITDCNISTVAVSSSITTNPYPLQCYNW